MDETGMVDYLRSFVSGNTLVFLYIAISCVRYIVVPLYKGSSVLRDFVSAATAALRDTGTGHAAIAAELRALNEILKIEKANSNS